ncbi:MAG: response regulator, partial [Myxococcales bacterium]|nr:response regulator [Myxococcales bacterium]
MPKKILLAEDSVTMQKVVQMTFSAEDYSVTAVSTVDEALARAKEVQPDIVIADLSMSGKNGYDLCQALKNGGNVPVLLLHGSAAPIDAGKAQSVGADGDLAKPFETQALIDKVSELTSAARPAAAARAPARAAAPPIESDIVIDTDALNKKPAAAKPAAPAAPKP